MKKIYFLIIFFVVYNKKKCIKYYIEWQHITNVFSYFIFVPHRYRTSRLQVFINKNYSTLMFADIVFGAFKFGRPILLLYLCSNFND